MASGVAVPSALSTGSLSRASIAAGEHWKWVPTARPPLQPGDSVRSARHLVVLRVRLQGPPPARCGATPLFLATRPSHATPPTSSFCLVLSHCAFLSARRWLLCLPASWAASPTTATPAHTGRKEEPASSQCLGFQCVLCLARLRHGWRQAASPSLACVAVCRQRLRCYFDRWVRVGPRHGDGSHGRA